MKFKRIFVIVTDSLGVGEMPDSHKYGDEGVNTLKHLSESKDDFSIPTLSKLGIGNITVVNNTPYNSNPKASFGKMKEISVGKDTLTGHWEIMGLNVKKSFPSFTDNGFPKELIDKLEAETNHKFIGNIAASGTEIIKELGERHLKTGELIIYTSADSVLQIAANENKVPLEELYRVCEIARKITLDNPEWMVGRIIARPFVGENSQNFTRTSNRHDYAVKPFSKTTLDDLKENGYDVIAVGKIKDIFDGEGITEAIKIKNNEDGMNKTIDIVNDKDFTGLCFVNLVDFDAIYGHRRNAIGYAECLEAFDKQLSRLIFNMNSDDLLIICADHGNDPTHTGTDHTREYVPLLVYTENYKGVDLGLRQTFADVSATISENFNLKKRLGESFLNEILNPAKEVIKKKHDITINDKILRGYHWFNSSPSKGIVLLVHGMAEHIDRYDEFASKLVEAGYRVYGYNQRGHKDTEPDVNDYGYMSDNDNLLVLLNDVKEYVEIIKNKHPNLPLYLFCHSMGSFIGQRFIQLYSSKIDGIVLSGSSRNSKLMVKSGNLVAKIVTKKRGRRYRSALLDKLSFGSYNKPFKPNRTRVDWLNRNPDEVDKYMNDPHCGDIFSASFFKDFTNLMNETINNDHLIRKDLPILLVAGNNDPVGNMGEGVVKLFTIYRNNGLNVELNLYPEARHEILLEENKDEVFNTIIKWLDRR